MSLLTLILLLPFAGAILTAFIPRNLRFGIRLLALLVTFLTLVCATILFFRFQPGRAGFQSVQLIPWVKALHIQYYVGVDGLNVALVWMAAAVAFAATCAAWEIKHHEKEFYLLLLVMVGGIIGAFASLDIFFFYFFHELALVPTFIMIGLWGRGEGKNYATFTMTLYLSLGALIALVGLIVLYLQPGFQTFNLPELIARAQAQPVPLAAQQLIFPLLLFGFGILVSLWPFHTWAPMGYRAAPTPTAMLHAGVLKKFGLYGLIRIALPLLPAGSKSWLPILAVLCLGNILVVGWVAMRQKDLNLLFGNSSVAHMGLIFLGIASVSVLGITGAVVIMVAHGLLAATSFGLSGYLYQQTNDLDMERLGGLLRPLPFVGTALVMAMMAGCGLPGFANFVGEILVFFGAWHPWTAAAVVAVWAGLVVGGVYMLRAIRRLLHGQAPEGLTLVDATPWRKVPFVLLLGSLLVFGCWPRLLTRRIKPSAERVVEWNRGTPQSPPSIKAARVLPNVRH